MCVALGLRAASSLRCMRGRAQGAWVVSYEDAVRSVIRIANNTGSDDSGLPPAQRVVEGAWSCEPSCCRREKPSLNFEQQARATLVRTHARTHLSVRCGRSRVRADSTRAQPTVDQWLAVHILEEMFLGRKAYVLPPCAALSFSITCCGG
jgi:hypothetical protein